MIVHPPVGKLAAVCENGALIDAPKTMTNRDPSVYFMIGLLFQMASLMSVIEMGCKKC